jgi:hypothetical protein
MQNGLGHYDASFESLIITCAYDGGHVKALTLANTAGDSIILVTEALTNEVWELRGNENKLLETYEDPIASATIFGHDAVGDGAWYAPLTCMYIVAGESFYYLLSSPHQVSIPIKMTAALWSDDAGNLVTVDISSDGVSWETVLDESDIQVNVAGTAPEVFVLRGTEYMRNVYIRFSCLAPSPDSFVLGSIKFEVERWIELDAVPVVEPGDSSIFTLSCNETYGDLVSIDGVFRPKRLHD